MTGFVSYPVPAGRRVSVQAGTIYPFVPTAGQQRDTALELQLDHQAPSGLQRVTEAPHVSVVHHVHDLLDDQRGQARVQSLDELVRGR